jgi:hypothetical protein
MDHSAAVAMITGFKSMASDPVKRQYLASVSMHNHDNCIRKEPIVIVWSTSPTVGLMKITLEN